MVRLAGGVSENILDHHGIVFFVAFARNVAEVRRAGDIIHLDQRMISADYRFLFVNIHRGHARSAGSERIGQRIFRDQPRPAGVHDQRGRFHVCQIVARNDAAGIFVERQMQAQDIRLGEKLLRLLATSKPAALARPVEPSRPQQMTRAPNALPTPATCRFFRKRKCPGSSR